MAEEKKKLFSKDGKGLWKEMTPRQRAAFIWEYYKFWIIGGTVVLLIAADMAVSWARSVNYAVTCLVPETVYTSTSQYWDDVSAALYPDSKSTKVEPLCAYENSESGTQTQSIRLLAMMDSGQVDVVICTKTTYEELIQSEILSDLSAVLTGGTFSSYKAHAIYGTTQDDPDKKPYALDISDSDFIDKTGFKSDEPVYLCITSNTQDGDNTIALFRYFADGIH